MKTYDEQNYPCRIRVNVEFSTEGVKLCSMYDSSTLDNTWTHFDWIKGLNEGHALYRAWQNWPDAVAITYKTEDAD